MKSPTPLKRYLSFQFILVGIVPVIIIAILTWWVLMPILRTQTHVQHHALALAIAGQVSSHMEGGHRQLQTLADYLQVREIPTDQDASPLLDTQCGQGEFFETLFIADKENMRIKSVGLAQHRRSERADLLGLDLSGRRLFHKTADPRTAFWSETFLSTVSSRLAIALTMPLSGVFITGEITLENLSEFISHLPVEAGFITLVMDSQNRVVADSRKQRLGQRLNLNPAGPHAIVRDHTVDHTHTFELDGQKLFGILLELDALQWKIFIAQPMDQAFKLLRNTYLLIILGLVFALGLASFISQLQAARTARLTRAYTHQAGAIAQGHYDIEWPRPKILEYANLSENLQRMADMIRVREKKLIDSETRLEITLDSIGDGVIATDEQGIITRLNPMAERLTGWNKRRGVGQPLAKVFNIVNSLTREPVDSPVDKVLSTGKIVGLANHTVLISRDGHEYQIADSGAPIRHPDGRTIGVVLVFRDVTESTAMEQALHAEISERTQTEAALRRRTAQLEAANVELDAFVYSISHDLRAPLRGLAGFSQALMEDYADKLEGDAVDYLTRIGRASQRMGQMIDDLLTLSRTTRRELSWERVDLSALVTTIAAELEERDPDRQVSFEIAPRVIAQGDPRVLRIVLENLLHNAWKFTSKHDRATILFGTRQLDGNTVYFVRDDGAGFDMTYADKLFGIFQRLHATTEFEGSGIGLAMVARLILRHGGRVWAEGEVGQGATFYFTLGTSSMEELETWRH